MIRTLPLLLLLACSNDSANGEDTGSVEAGPEPTPVSAPSNGECPTLTAGGTMSFQSADVERTIQVFLPGGDTQDLPLLFLWYPVGWNATQFAQATNAAQLAIDLNMVVVLPEETDGNLFAWEFVNHPAPHDLTLFEDVRSCASDQLGIDLKRVYTSGMSAGALWSTYLTMHRADALAASLILSGGTEPAMEYESPAEDIPVLMFHGGQNDIWDGGMISFNFYDATMAAADDFVDDLSTVVVCSHTGGHNFPPSQFQTVETWLLQHTFGQPSPFEGGDLSTLPAGCTKWAAQ